MILKRVVQWMPFTDRPSIVVQPRAVIDDREQERAGMYNTPHDVSIDRDARGGRAREVPEFRVRNSA
ncbi:MAG: hypothetical protein ACRD5D_02700 [Candidatus Polarisedimenticolia bacterium]